MEAGVFMTRSVQVITLFTLNALDAFLTLYWVRNGMATEGNGLMATLLDIGDLPFLGVKLSIGALTAFVLWYYRDFKMSAYGTGLALGIYALLMCAHTLTGLIAFGYLAEADMLHLFEAGDRIFTFFA